MKKAAPSPQCDGRCFFLFMLFGSCQLEYFSSSYRNMPRIITKIHANLQNTANQRERFTPLRRFLQFMRLCSFVRFTLFDVLFAI